MTDLFVSHNAAATFVNQHIPASSNAHSLRQVRAQCVGPAGVIEKTSSLMLRCPFMTNVPRDAVSGVRVRGGFKHAPAQCLFSQGKSWKSRWGTCAVASLK